MSNKENTGTKKRGSRDYGKKDKEVRQRRGLVS